MDGPSKLTVDGRYPERSLVRPGLLDVNHRQLTPLFHPRRDQWVDHFRWRGPRLVGLTPIGRVTIQVLNINHPEDIKLRRLLIAEGMFPSDIR